MRNRALSLCLPVVAAAFSPTPAALASNIDWVTIGAPGNASDTTGFGSVAYTFQISKYEITNAQYAEFLNAVAAADPNEVYDDRMGSDATHGGIVRSGTYGSLTYGPKAGFADKPVNFVSFYDSLRFANWLHNGQPAGAQGNATTEDGAYTITAAGIAANSITRNTGAKFTLTSENEWYKAAYYDAISASYFGHSTGTNTPPTCATPTATVNRANCGFVVGTTTNGGAYSGSPSPFGTFDQCGNVMEWNETIMSFANRGLRGGGWQNGAWGALDRSSDTAVYGVSMAGFRISMIAAPVPLGSIAGPAVAALLVTTGLFGLAYGQTRPCRPSQAGRSSPPGARG